MKKLGSIVGALVIAAAICGGQQESSRGSFPMGSNGATQAGLIFNSNFDPRFSWYVAAVQQRVRSNWPQSAIDPSLRSAPRVIVTFDILRNGAITNIQITQSSKNYYVDESARKAVEQSSPLMALPAAYGDWRVSVKLYVDYKNQIATQPHDAAEPSSSHGMVLPNCSRGSAVQPKVVSLACADGNFFIENISWTGWGASFAAGYGDGKINDCKPSCAAGHFRAYPMLLIAAGKQTCSNGQPAYEKVIYAFIGRSPLPQDGDPTREFPCTP